MAGQTVSNPGATAGANAGGGGNASNALYLNSFRISATADRLAMHVDPLPENDLVEFCQLCLSLGPSQEVVGDSCSGSFSDRWCWVSRPPPTAAAGGSTGGNNVNVEAQVVPEVRLNIKSFEEGSLKGEEREKECVICITGFQKGEISTVLCPCNHKFHSDCIAIWLALHQTCPICRASTLSPVS